MTPREELAAFHARLRSLTDVHGFTAASLAKAIGIERQAIYHFWQGNGFPRPATTRRLAEVLGCAAGWLLFGEGDAPAILTQSPDAPA